MPEFAQILALALLPAAGNFAGGLVAQFVPGSRKALNLALHAAAGILIAVGSFAVRRRRSSCGRWR